VFTNTTYPTELSLQAFLPSYLDARLDRARPRVVATPAVVLESHRGMNQRLAELAVGRVTQLGVTLYEAEVAAPPTPGVVPPGYYLWFIVHAGVPSSATCGTCARSGRFYEVTGLCCWGSSLFRFYWPQSATSSEEDDRIFMDSFLNQLCTRCNPLIILQGYGFSREAVPRLSTLPCHRKN
jgi:hypothetical protein